MRRQVTVIMLVSPFLASVFGAWAWFNTDIGRSASEVSGPWSLVSGPQQRLWLTARTNIPGYIFILEPVSESVKKTLGTTNILSGSFYKIAADGNQKSEIRNQTTQVGDTSLVLTSETALDAGRWKLDAQRITVFLASWASGSNRGFKALSHTPDTCWGGSGWKPLDLGQPQQVVIELPIAEIRDQKSEVSGQTAELTSVPRPLTSGAALDPRRSTAVSSLQSPATVSLPFVFRVFELPDGRSHEATAWCALVGGQALIGSTEWGTESISISSAGYYVRSRALQLRQILQAIQSRLPVRREKQFVRYSAPLNLDWRSAIETIHAFGSAWLCAVRVRETLPQW